VHTVKLKLTRFILLIACASALLAALQPALCWSNGGYSDNPAHPDYGTHDWIAQHALDYLPAQEKQYIVDNLAVYLYGTELPDRPASQGGIGDTTKHHVYYSSTGALVDDASAKRAQDEYNLALNFLKAGDYVNASKTAGALTHYIADVAVFGHVMGSSTAWGAETHHSDYENYVTDRMTSYQSSFNTYLSFDGCLVTLPAYNATVNLAYDTTFGGGSHLSCVWMDTNYDWSKPTFSGRCGESLNLAVNAVADVLHTLAEAAGPVLTTVPTVVPSITVTAPTPTSSDSPTSSPTQNRSPSTTPTVPEFPLALCLCATLLILTVSAIIYKKNTLKNQQFI
jgi:hypothetical protein